MEQIKQGEKEQVLKCVVMLHMTTVRKIYDCIHWNNAVGKSRKGIFEV